MQAFILAGGYGTRLSSTVPGLPKTMAPIGDRPFLEYLVTLLAHLGIQSITMLTGYLAPAISNHFGDGKAYGLKIDYSVEDEPLGTGGAVARALRTRVAGTEQVLLLNGDTFFDIDLKALSSFRDKIGASITICLKLMERTERYGSVILDGSQVCAFAEKSPALDEGYINGGVYLLDRSALDLCPDCKRFSLEAEILPRALARGALAGLPFGGHFIDIGVPEDYAAARDLLPRWATEKKRKAAFLDRDGTLIEDHEHVHRLEDLRIREDSIPLLKGLASAGFDLFVVTNQAGIAKGLYSEVEALAFNAAVTSRLADRGIHIIDSAICPYHEEGLVENYRRSSLRRKPRPGMLLDLADRYAIDLPASVMIGNNKSDRIELDYLPSFILGEDGDYAGILEAILNGE